MQQMMRVLMLLVPFLFQMAEAADDVNKGKYITLKTAYGTTFQAYVAGSKDSTRGVLLLPDRWGISENIRQWTERFAAKGYRALAIDVFDGRASSEMWLATEIVNATDPEAAMADVMAGLRYLRGPGRKVATVGWGFGGWQSFQAAIRAPSEMAATVLVYGEMSASLAQIRTLRAPIMGIFALGDDQITAEDVATYEAMMQAKQVLVTFESHTLDGPRGFADSLHPGFDPRSEQKARELIESFVDTHVGRGF